MKNKVLILPFVGILVTTLSGCKTTYEYGTLNNLLYNHFDCGTFEHCPFDTKANFDFAYDSKEIVINNLKKINVKAVDSIVTLSPESFQYRNSVLAKEKNMYYSSVLTLWNDGYIKVDAQNPNDHSKNIVNNYKISADDAKKINDEVAKWFVEVERMEKEFLEFATFENVLKAVEKSDKFFYILNYHDNKGSSTPKLVSGEFAKKINEATFTYLGSYDELNMEYRKNHNASSYGGERFSFSYSPIDDQEKFEDQSISMLQICIYDDGNAMLYIHGDDKADRNFVIKTYYSLDENKAKEIIEAAQALNQ